MIPPDSLLSVLVSPVTLREEWIEDITRHCPRCGAPLEVHQPQIDRPDRLLETCTECDLWEIYLIVSPTKAITLLIPGDDDLLSLSHH